MTRRGFFASIAAAVTAGVVLPRESIIVSPPHVIAAPRPHILIPTRYALVRDPETGIHIRTIPDPAQRLDVRGLIVTQTMTRAEFAKRYPAGPFAGETAAQRRARLLS